MNVFMIHTCINQCCFLITCFLSLKQIIENWKNMKTKEIPDTDTRNTIAFSRVFDKQQTTFL